MTRSTHPTLQHSPKPTSGGPGATSFLSALASLLGAASFFTQRIAHTFAYHPRLGPAWLEPPLPPFVLLLLAAAALALPAWALAAPQRRPAAPALLLPSALLFALAHGPLFHPAVGLRWARLLLGTRWSGLVTETLVQTVAVLAAGIIATAVLYRTSGPRRTDLAAVAHGSARLANHADLAAADLLSGQGLVLGAVPRGRGRDLLTDRSRQHALIVMPPGGGKTTGPIATTLLNTPEDSALVLDPKGELYDLTAGWRASRGQRIVRFAPVAGGLHGRWNPLDEIPRGGDEAGVVSALTDNLVSYPADVDRTNHWTAAARSLLRCLVLHELYVGREPSLASVRTLLSADEDAALDELFRQLATSEHDRDGIYGWRDRDGAPTRTHPEVIHLARSFRTTPDRERGSIVSTLQRFLDLWFDPAVTAATATSDWSLSLLTAADRPTTVYVTGTFEKLARLAPLLRVLVALLVHRLTVSDVPYRDVAVADRRRVLLVLDEFASLGRLPLLEEALAFLRGYGVTAMLAIQDLGQIHRLYTRSETFTGTCGIHVASATANLTTRGDLSRRAGVTTVVYPKTSSTGSFAQRKTTRHQAEVGRQLLTEDEIGGLAAHQLLVVKQGCPAILADRVPYWEHPIYARRAQLAPPKPRRHAPPPPPAAPPAEDTP